MTDRDLPAWATPAWLDRSRYPFHPHALEAPYGRLHYLDEGPRDAPPVVLVHGVPTWSWLWRELIPKLARHHRVIAPDHLGFGLSAAPRPSVFGYRPADHSRVLGELVDHLGLSSVTLVLHDFGGLIGFGWAVDHPERVDRLALSNTFLWPFETATLKLAGRLIASPVGRWLYLRADWETRVVLPLVGRGTLDPVSLRSYRAAQGSPERRRTTWELARTFAADVEAFRQPWERRDRLTAKPALLLWGLADAFFGTPALERWQRVFPDATTVAYPGVGHFTAEEHAGPMADAILAFTGQS